MVHEQDSGSEAAERTATPDVNKVSEYSEDTNHSEKPNVTAQNEPEAKEDEGLQESTPTARAKGKGKQSSKDLDLREESNSEAIKQCQMPTEKPFDFNRFLEQMKHRSAVPVNEYVRSFFRGFTRRPYKPDEQAKLIFDFLEFIAARMLESTVFSELPPYEFDQATEAMEKLVMNRLYTYTFSPAIAMEGRWTVQTDDLERDRLLSERIRLFAWVREEQLDVKKGQHSERFYNFAVQELNKVNHYKAPRDKMICILNCCKVIFGLIRHLGSDESADAFMPLLILVVLRANPPNLISNLEYIQRFRSPPRRTSESEYYLSSLAGAIAFIEQMDHTKLSHTTQMELDERIQHEAARMEEEETEKSESTSRPFSVTASMAAVSLADDTRAFIQRTGEAARHGLNRLFTERPDMIGSEMQPMPSTQVASQPETPAASTIPTLKPARGEAPNAPLRGPVPSPMRQDSPASVSTPHTRTDAVPRWRSGLVPRFGDDEDDDLRDSPSHHVAAVRYAEEGQPLVEDEEHQEEDEVSVDVTVAIQTLQSIFPQADSSVLQLVLEECGYNVETSIDRLLEMT